VVTGRPSEGGVNIVVAPATAPCERAQTDVTYSGGAIFCERSQSTHARGGVSTSD